MTPIRATLLVLALATSAAAQTPAAQPAAKPAPAPKAAATTHAATPATAAKAATAPKPATPSKPGTPAVPAAAKPLPHPVITNFRVPTNIPHVRGVIKPAFAFGFQDSLIGTGADAAPLKLYTVKYTGYLAADGTKFDSSDDHDSPKRDADGKPVMGPDNKPVMIHGAPAQFVVGAHRVIQGWDLGFEGMKVGGMRRLFIPWQLAYGENGRPPVIPAKADLIFDVELVAIEDLPNRQAQPGMPPARPATPGAFTPKPAAPATPPQPTSAAPASAPAAAPTTPAPSAPATPTQPTTPPQPKQ